MDSFATPESEAAQPSGLGLALAVVLTLILIPLIHAASGAIGAQAALSWALEAAPLYDAHYDPIVVRDGAVSMGPRIVHDVDEGKRTFLVDPDETVSAAEVTTPEALIVRRHEIINIRPYRDQIISVGELQEGLGLGDLVIDSSHIADFVNTHWASLTAAMAAVFLLFSLWDFVFVPGCALVAAGIVSVTLSKRGVTFRSALAVALLAAVSTVVIRWLLVPVGLGSQVLVGMLVWPAYTAVVTAGVVVTLQDMRG